MLPIIDFRNGRYQGQTKNQLPDGVGILIDKNYLFCLAEWVAGQIEGRAVIIFPSGKVFCGQIHYRKASQLCSYQLAEDHVRLVTYAHESRPGEVSKLAGILPLLSTILEIDNTDTQQAIVIQQHVYSPADQMSNLNCINKILNMDQNGLEGLKRQRHCLNFMEKYFAEQYDELIQFLISETRGKKQYFIGIRGEGLGIKIQPLEDPNFQKKKTGRVYLVRGVGMFTRQNQMKDLGLKTIDNAMKGVIMQQGIFSIPSTVIKYQMGKRPVNSVTIFYNHLKRSLHYRDKIILTEYIYELQSFVRGFNDNLRKVQTQKLAQVTIQRPNNSGNNLMAIEHKRVEKERQRQDYIKRKDETVQLTVFGIMDKQKNKLTNQEFNILRAKDQILRSASKRQRGGDSVRYIDYNNVQYVDPKFVKVSKVDRPPRNYEAYRDNQSPQRGSKYLDRGYAKDRDEYDRGYQRNSSYSRRNFQSRFDSPSRRDLDRSYEKGYEKRYYPENRYEPDRALEYEPVRRQQDQRSRSPARKFDYDHKSPPRRFQEQNKSRSPVRGNVVSKSPLRRQEYMDRPTAPIIDRTRSNKRRYGYEQDRRQKERFQDRDYIPLPNNSQFRRGLFRDNYFQ